MVKLETLPRAQRTRLSRRTQTSPVSVKDFGQMLERLPASGAGRGEAIVERDGGGFHRRCARDPTADRIFPAD